MLVGFVTVLVPVLSILFCLLLTIYMKTKLFFVFARVNLQNQVCDSARLNTKNFRQYYFMVIIPHVNHSYTGLEIGKQILSC